jgi:hypothetical protein
MESPPACWAGWHAVRVPEGSVAGARVRHLPYDAGSAFATASPRTMIYGGHDSGPVAFPEAGHFHELSDEDGVWMTDRPIETVQMWDLARRASGEVLVGGLGLGVLPALLHLTGRCRGAITVVERDPRVIDLAWEALCERTAQLPNPLPLHLIEDDLREFVKGGRDRAFDFAIYDTWRSDGVDTLLSTVVPLRADSHRSGIVRHPECVLAWNEDVMRAQLYQALTMLYHFHVTMAKGSEQHGHLFAVEPIEEVAGALREAAKEDPGNPHHRAKLIWAEWLVRNQDEGPRAIERAAARFARCYGYVDDAGHLVG